MMRWFRAVVMPVAGGEAIVWPAVLAGVLAGVASYLVGSTRGDVRVDVAMASMATFLFGVLLAFTIVRTRERLSLVQDLVAKGNSALLSIYQMLAAFGEEDRRRVRELVDGHLTDQIDYRLVDYHLATPSLPRPDRRRLRPRSRGAPAGGRLQGAGRAVHRHEHRPVSRSRPRPGRRCPPSSGAACSSCWCSSSG